MGLNRETDDIRQKPYHVPALAIMNQETGIGNAFTTDHGNQTTKSAHAGVPQVHSCRVLAVLWQLALQR